jgi:hypothetical protein
LWSISATASTAVVLTPEGQFLPISHYEIWAGPSGKSPAFDLSS